MSHFLSIVCEMLPIQATVASNLGKEVPRGCRQVLDPCSYGSLAPKQKTRHRVAEVGTERGLEKDRSEICDQPALANQ